MGCVGQADPCSPKARTGEVRCRPLGKTGEQGIPLPSMPDVVRAGAKMWRRRRAAPGGRNDFDVRESRR
jgi:hypothetical protein